MTERKRAAGSKGRTSKGSRCRRAEVDTSTRPAHHWPAHHWPAHLSPPNNPQPMPGPHPFKSVHQSSVTNPPASGFRHRRLVRGPFASTLFRHRRLVSGRERTAGLSERAAELAVVVVVGGARAVGRAASGGTSGERQGGGSRGGRAAGDQSTHAPLCRSTSRRTAGRSVMIPSTPRSSSRAISSGESTVQT